MALEVMDLVVIKIRGQFYVYKGRRLPGQTVVYQTVYVYHGDGRWLCWMIRGDPGRLRTGISEIITKSSNCPADVNNILNAKLLQLSSIRHGLEV